MVKKRVHEVAKELKIESKEIIKKLNDEGIDVKSHMSMLADRDLEWLLRQYGKGPAKPERQQGAPPAPARVENEAAKKGAPAPEAKKGPRPDGGANRPPKTNQSS